MATNPYVNKVEYGGNTLIDLTGDTVTPNALLQGYTAHGPSGAPISGTLVQPISISGATVTLIPNTFVYDGTEKTQGVASVVLDGETLTEGTDYVVTGDAHTNAGTYALNILGVNAYNGAIAVSWSIAKAHGTISVSPASVSIQGIGGSETATITYTGDGNVSVSSSDTGVATPSISGDTVAITGVASGTATITVTLGEGNNYLGASAQISAEVVATRIYGVSWPKTSTTKLSRTDDAALFTDPVPAVSGGNGSSPFDNQFPWSGMVRETISGNEMVKIPKFWFKWTNKSGSLKLQISNTAVEGFHVSPAHADRGDGKGERDYVYIGRYHCDSAYKSVTGASPISNIKRATARSGCKGLGTGFYQLDYAMWWTVRMLYLVEYADWDSQTVIGYGGGNNSATHNSGASDPAQYHTGTMQNSRTAYGDGVQYRYIEDPWGNVLDWCDGIVTSSNAAYVCNDPSKYGDTTSKYTKVSNGISSSGCISGWSVPTISGLEWALYPNAIVSDNNYSTYCADRATTNSSGVVVYVGGSYGQSRSTGMFYSNTQRASNTTGSIGARLQYLP